MTTVGKALVVIALVGGLLGLRALLQRADGGSVASPSNPAAIPTLPHADHFPRHGGLVFMNGDTHLEVLLSAAGDCRVYFTDAVRVQLPPTHASEVTIAITSGNHHQQIALQMDANQNAWIGRLDPVEDPNAIVRVAYLAKGERPYWIDLPASALRGGAPVARLAGQIPASPATSPIVY